MYSRVPDVADLERQRAFRRCVGSFATGVCVVTADGPDGPAGMTLNSFTSVSLDPMLVLVSLAHGARTQRAVSHARRFAISVLGRRQREVALAFALRGADFPLEHTTRTDDGYLVVRHALAALHCALHDVVTAGDHDLVLGRVEAFSATVGEPLVFHAGLFAGVAPDLEALPPPELFDEGFGW
jgi:3-hydroxy-9,10-secoandrosta-1,3,5(10)-triene-9,17-dione monooxygenase reductase component